METIFDRFICLYGEAESNPNAFNEMAELVLSAPVTPETTGLLAFMYHEGVGVEQDLDKAFRMAELAVKEGNDPTGLFLLGFMCDNEEIPADSGYIPDDCLRFYEACAGVESRWRNEAILWLGDYFMGQGDDPEVAVSYYESIGENDAEAAGNLSDYYWKQHLPGLPDDLRDLELEEKVFFWTSQAVRLNPHDYSYRMGCVYYEGIGCDAEKGFRLARKYWEDAYDYDDTRAADSIVFMFEERVASLPDDKAHKDERSNCLKQIESWRKLAERQRERLEGKS